MTSLRRRAIAAGVTRLATCFLAACGDREEPSEPAAEAEPSAIEKAASQLPPEGRVEVEHNDDGGIRYSGETEEGERYIAQLGGEVVVPKAFAEDLPLYPDSVPFSAMESGEDYSIIGLNTDAPASVVYEFYKEQLSAFGWSLDRDLNVGGGRVLMGFKDDRKAVIHIETTQEGTRISFVLGPAS